VDTRYSYTYDANGNRLTEKMNVDADAALDALCTYTYDARGNRLTAEWDFSVDGIIDIRCTYTHDANGNRLTEDCRPNADFGMQMAPINFFDIANTKISELFDLLPIGRRVYRYGVDGNRLSDEWYVDSAGSMFVRRDYTYDANGNMLTAEWKIPLVDGRTVVERTTYTYDCWE
jgi:hypothetical protein